MFNVIASDCDQGFALFDLNEDQMLVRPQIFFFQYIYFAVILREIVNAKFAQVIEKNQQQKKYDNQRSNYPNRA